MIRITAKKDGFRRAGIAHGKEPTDYPDDHFSAKQLEALRAEPMLTVEELEDEGKKPTPNPPGDGKKKDKDTAGGKESK